MTIGEKVSYLKGLIEGLDIDKGKKESKIILAMVDIIEDLALTVDDIEEDLDEVMDFVEELDEDLSDVEDDLYGDEDDDDDDCCCDEPMYEVTCPTCGETIYVDEDTLTDVGSMPCPNCGEELELDTDFAFDDEEECGCCDCGGDHEEKE